MDFAQPDHNVASAEKAAKQKRAKAYSDARMEIIKTEVGAGAGYRSIVKKYPAFGFTESGVRDAIRRLKAGGIERKQGGGSPRTARTAENVSKV